MDREWTVKHDGEILGVLYAEDIRRDPDPSFPAGMRYRILLWEEAAGEMYEIDFANSLQEVRAIGRAQWKHSVRFNPVKR